MKTSEALETRISPEHQNLGELIKNLSKLSSHIQNDIEGSPDGRFPLVIRKIQFESIRSLVSCIEESLNILEASSKETS